jgi:tRNA(fMet)-specific endonuclease VapC
VGFLVAVGGVAAVRAFRARVTVHCWDDDTAEHHAHIRVTAKLRGRSAGVFDIMIAAHALALGQTLVTGDKAIGNLRIAGLQVVAW